MCGRGCDRPVRSLRNEPKGGPAQQTHNVNTTLYNVVRGLFSQRCEKDVPATLLQHKMTTL